MTPTSPILPYIPPEESSLGRILLRTFLWIAAIALFSAACYFSAIQGIALARHSNPAVAASLSKFPTGIEIVMGEGGQPVYVADTTETLRKFYLEHPTEASRMSSDITGTGIRRLFGRIEAQTLRSLPDAVQIRVTSGAIAGAIYWVHRELLPEKPGDNPVISPLPE